jgi:transposase-like protein
MQIVKIFINGKKQGIRAITQKDEVTDILLDTMNDGIQSKEFVKAALKLHLEKGLAFIPNTEKPFDWDENIHGNFFAD